MSEKQPWRLSLDSQYETSALAIRPGAICFVNGVMQIECGEDLPDIFWLHLAEVIPPILFQRFKETGTDFVAIEPLEVHSEAQPLLLLPRVCLRGVWWTRQAAVEADRSISAFVQAEDRHD